MYQISTQRVEELIRKINYHGAWGIELLEKNTKDIAKALQHYLRLREDQERAEKNTFFMPEKIYIPSSEYDYVQEGYVTGSYYGNTDNWLSVDVYTEDIRDEYTFEVKDENITWFRNKADAEKALKEGEKYERTNNK